ncbi:hypothetical protein AVEN_198893-1 [Araneus ventricosus]|uniref:Uncharacterized protein n=1 Tax=Araneus ventricosus TaxID=182803 RepID=A0A4Y2DQY1_ARAVE|nr:hypothetical protein AVEN_198893-1 [Araneus ventricosus]
MRFKKNRQQYINTCHKNDKNCNISEIIILLFRDLNRRFVENWSDDAYLGETHHDRGAFLHNFMHGDAAVYGSVDDSGSVHVHGDAIAASQSTHLEEASIAYENRLLMN